MFERFCSRFSFPPIQSGGETSTCIAFGLAACYFAILPIGETIALRNLAFYSLLFLTLWRVWRHGLQFHLPLAWPWMLYGAIALLSVTYSVDPLWSLGEIKKEVGYGILVLALTATWVRNIPSLERLLIAAIAGNIFLVAAVLFKITMLNPIWEMPFSEIVFTLYRGEGKDIYQGVGNFSTYLITITPFVAAFAFMRDKPSRSWQYTLFGLFALNILGIVLTFNRAGLLALTAQLIFAGSIFLKVRQPVMKTRSLVPVAAVSAGLLALGIWVMQTRPPVHEDIRGQMWSWAISDIIASPLEGGGFGRTIMLMYDPAFVHAFGGLEHAHNMVLNKGIQMGLPGIISFLVLLGATFRALWPSRSLFLHHRRLWGYTLAAATMSVGVFLKNMTDDFFVNYTAFLYWALVGMVLGALHHSLRKE